MQSGPARDGGRSTALPSIKRHLMMIWGTFFWKAVPGHGLAPLPARGAAWRLLRPPCTRSEANAEWTGDGCRVKRSVAEHLKVFNDDLG